MKTSSHIEELSTLPAATDRSTQARTLTPRQRRLIDYLKRGGKYSVIDIANALHIGDPRSEIRTLRKMGLAVSDEWVATASGNRYKRFWIGRE